MISFAQNFEDVILWRIFKDVQSGFYIDLGAWDPVVDSVSNWFYMSGWQGIDVEPHSDYYMKLKLARPRNIVLKSFVSDEPGLHTFSSISNSGLSTGNTMYSEKLKNSTDSISQLKIETITLDEIFDLVADSTIHWLKIDIEGSESSALRSWKLSEQRPWVIVIEATLPNSQIDVSSEWEKLVLEKGYKFVLFDGLNKYYLHSSKTELTELFEDPPNYFDFFELSGLSSNSFCNLVNAELANTQTELANTQTELANTQTELTKTISVFQNSRSWKFTKVLREAMSIFEQGKVKNLDFLVWKIRSKLAYEKRRLKTSVLKANERHPKSSSNKIILNDLRQSNKPWVHPDLVQLTKKRLNRK